jgi:hypothetical protein
MALRLSMDKSSMPQMPTPWEAPRIDGELLSIMPMLTPNMAAGGARLAKLLSDYLR